MIRFIDLTTPDGPCCSFMDTDAGSLVKGGLVYAFESLAEVQAISDERCLALVPDGFFEPKVALPVAFEACEFLGDWGVYIAADDVRARVVPGLTEAEAKRLATALNLVVAGKPDPAVAELTADNDRLHALMAGDIPKFRSIVAAPGGGIAAQFTPHWMLKLVADCLGELLGDAVNYVEVQAEHSVHGDLTFTIARRAGQTPHQKRVEAEQRAADLQARLDTVGALAQDLLAAQVAEKNHSNALQTKLDAALAFADPTARKSLLAALSPETIEAYLRARGWTVAGEHGPFHSWSLDEARVAVPLRRDIPRYAARVVDVFTEIARAERRLRLAVYLDMVTP